jgi:2-desacetyl-2-hydroxyethyl bacteriochlorophyllide A dehydrogenase
VKAAVLTRVGEITGVADWPEPVPGPGDVIVALTGLGVCGSDVAIWSGDRVVDFPWIGGHEGTGTIVAAGEGVSQARIGERVVIEPNYPCGQCAGCRGGRTALCSRRQSVGITVPGLLQERAAVPAQFAWTAPDSLTDEDLVCVEPMTVALHAAQLSQVAAGSGCLIVGAGSQGLLLLLVLRAMGAEVAVVEPHDGRLAIARSLGAQPMTGTGYELVFETSGSVAGTQQAVRSLGIGGNLVLIGIPHRDVPLPTASIVRGHQTVRGSIIYDHPGDFSAALAFITAHSVPLASVIRRTFRFAEAQTALSTAASVPGKSWIKF